MNMVHFPNPSFGALILIFVIPVLFNSCKTSNADQEVRTEAEFTFNCDLNGQNGRMLMQVEVVANTGITWGSGSNPDITGVISTGDYTLFTTGSVTSDAAYYTFTGENNFADFVDQTFNQRFLVEWREINNGLLMVVNPFGPGPTSHTCILVSSRYL